MRNCEARQYSDQMHCNRCGHVWDMNDHEPPKCRSREDINRQLGAETIRAILEDLSTNESK